MAGERGRLGGDALLQVAVARDHVDEVVERRRAGSGIRIEQAALVAGGVREAHRGRQALAERAGRDLDAVGVPVLRVARGQRAPRAQRLQVVELEPEPAEVELHVLRQRGVPGREDEPVAPDPVRVGGVVPHHALVEQVRRRRQAHRRARVAVADLLHRVRRQHAGGVHRAPIDLIPTQFRHRAAFLEEVRPDVAGSAALVRMEKGESARGARVFSIAKGWATAAMRDLYVSQSCEGPDAVDDIPVSRGSRSAHHAPHHDVIRRRGGGGRGAGRDTPMP